MILEAVFTRTFQRISHAADQRCPVEQRREAPLPARGRNSQAMCTPDGSLLRLLFWTDVLFNTGSLSDVAEDLSADSDTEERSGALDEGEEKVLCRVE